MARPDEPGDYRLWCIHANEDHNLLKIGGFVFSDDIIMKLGVPVKSCTLGV